MAASAAADSRVKNALGQLPLFFIENHGQTDPRAAFYIRGKDKVIYFTSTGLVFVLTDTARRAAARAGAATAPPAERRALRLEFVGGQQIVPRGEDPTPAVISYFKGTADQWKIGLKNYSKLVYADLWPGIDLVYSGSASRLKYQFVVRPGADPACIRLAYRGAESVGINEKQELEVTTPVGGFHDDKPLAYQESDGARAAVPVAYALGVDGRDYGFRLGGYDAGKTLVIDPAILVYAGFIGGTEDDRAKGIAVDGEGAAYVTGETSSTETTFPDGEGFESLTGVDLIQNGGVDAFVAKVSPDGAGLVYATFLGGSGDDRGNAIALKSGCAADCEAYVTGETSDAGTDFPTTTGAFDASHNGGVDAFVARLNSTGTALTYATFLGGSGTDRGNGIAVDSSGAAYVTGETSSSNFPVTTGAFDTILSGVDAFVAKLNATGTALAYATFLGGSGTDIGRAIAVSPVCVVPCEAYVTGETGDAGTDFPVTTGSFDELHNGGVDAFVAKVNAAGDGLVYSGFIGGSGSDIGNGIAVDGSGAAYVAGETTSTETVLPHSFPVLTGPDTSHNDGVDAFVAKVNAAGSALVYAGYIGGSGTDRGKAIALDPGCVSSCSAYVTGETDSTETSIPNGFPVLTGPGTSQNGGVDAFIAKVKGDGTGLLLAGFIGGSADDSGNAIAVDLQGGAYVAGETASNEITFPNLVGPDLIQNGLVDAFVAKVCTTSCVDLKLSKTSSSPGVQPGANLTYTLTVTNNGPDGAGGVTAVDPLPSGVTFVSATPSAGTCSGTTTVTCALGALADGASATVTIVVTTTGVGTVENTATVSADETDVDPTNNEASSTVKVSFADLRVQKFSVPHFVAPGQMIVLKDTTVNISKVDADPSTTRFFLSSDRVVDGGDTVLGARPILALAPSGHDAGSTPVTISAPLGKYFLIAMADADGVINEANENNNTLVVGTIQVTLPDLVVAKLAAPISASVGSSIKITDTTQNRGQIPAGASTTAFYLSADAIFDGGDTLLDSHPVPALKPGKKSSGSTIVTIPAGCTGPCFIIAVADDGSVVDETNDEINGSNNNIRAKSITITP
ncbi:MAG TPA: CARDB domain-containing protein [Candidatus Binatia bacterium]